MIAEVMLEAMFGIELLPTLSLNLKSPVATKFGTVFTRGAVQSQNTGKKTKHITGEDQILNKIKHHTYYQQSHLDTGALRTLLGTKKLLNT